jgi:hypothetical protein
MTLADGDLVDADDARSGTAGPAELLPHVLLVQFLDRLPVEVQFLGDGLDGALPAAPAHVEGEPLGAKGIVGQPLQPLALHAAAPPAPETANRELEVDPLVATGKIPHQPRTLVVEGPPRLPTHATARFFRRRRRGMTTTYGSPKIPWTLA